MQQTNKFQPSFQREMAKGITEKGLLLQKGETYICMSNYTSLNEEEYMSMIQYCQMIFVILQTSQNKLAQN